MKTLKFLLLTLLAVSMVTACSVDTPKQDLPESREQGANTIFPVEIEPVLIGKGELHPYLETDPNIVKSMVITSVDEWNTLKTAMDDRNNTLPEIDVDFSAYRVIAIFDKIHGNGGWSIDITGIVEDPDKIVVSVTNLKIGNIASVITQPYHIVKIPVSSKKIVFEFQ
jgi:hypothetical protein